MKKILVVTILLSVAGCFWNGKPMTAEEQEEQGERMREFLDESSPRNRNQQPKVVPEFVKEYSSQPSSDDEDEE